jgi:hypothetical protein
MAWSISQASIDYNGNKAVVAFIEAGGLENYPKAVNVSFILGAPGQPITGSFDERALVAQAKQILMDAVNSEEMGSL